MSINVITGEDNIRKASLLSLKGALALEAHGMKRSRGSSALTIVRENYGIKARTAKKALPEFIQYLIDKEGMEYLRPQLSEKVLPIIKNNKLI